jgi:hypothetical protein
MMGRSLIAFVMLAATAGAVAAQDASKLPPFKATDYPIEIRKALSYGPEECRRQGGGKVTFAPDTVRKIDLTGDGVDDYIISFGRTQCAGLLAVYCGTAGCTHDIYVTRTNGKQRMVFSDRVRTYEILPGEGARTIRFDMHGSYCGRAGAEACFKEHRISDRPFEFREPMDR